MYSPDKYRFGIRKVRFFLPFICLYVMFICCDNSSFNQAEKTKEYLHISHTRTDVNPDLIEGVELINYKKYDKLFLGGDLALSTSLDDMSMNYLDSVFDFKNTNTLWSVGNHDYSDSNRISAYTERALSYTFHADGITYLILDTQTSKSNIEGDQKKIFDAVVDSIKESSHLIILHHKLIWMAGNLELEPKIDSVSNAELGSCSYCINPNNFYTAIYPKMVMVKSKGVDVICIGGDIGKKIQNFEHITPDGIVFLASGMAPHVKENYGLVFKHDLNIQSLTWEYTMLKDL